MIIESYILKFIINYMKKGEKNMDIRMLNVEKDLIKVNKHIERLCKSDSLSMQKVMDFVLLNRGKQLRPILTILCSRLKNKNVDVTEIAAVVEMCHTASLIHDDIIDNADMRRGQASVQTKFGKEMAVYAGDFMIFSAIGRTKLTNKLWYKSMFNKLELMSDGEVNQYDHLYDLSITEEKYIKNIVGKTSALFEIACVAGAYEGKCNKEEREKVEQFARCFGIAFQIRDDLMDFISNKAISEKTIHNDFRSGYYTLPAIFTFNSDKYGDELKEIALSFKNDEDENDTLNKRIHDLIINANGFEYTYRVFKKYLSMSIDSLASFKETDSAKKLFMILDYLDNSVNELMSEVI